MFIELNFSPDYSRLQQPRFAAFHVSNVENPKKQKNYILSFFFQK